MRVHAKYVHVGLEESDLPTMQLVLLPRARQVSPALPLTAPAHRSLLTAHLKEGHHKAHHRDAAIDVLRSVGEAVRHAALVSRIPVKQRVRQRIVKDLLTIFSPVCPFFTHHLSETLYGVSAVDIRAYPQSQIENNEEASRLRKLTNALCDFNSETWRAKKDLSLSLNAEIEGITVPEILSEFAPELTAMHKLQ